MTSIDTLTDDQIRSLRAESASAGDLRQTAICDRALNELDADSRIADRDAIRRALRLTVSVARAECVRVITDAEAMQD